MEWYSNLDFLLKTYWLIAIIGSLVFTVVILLAFIEGILPFLFKQKSYNLLKPILIFRVKTKKT